MTKFKLDIQPISVNKCWQGRRWKTEEYKRWRYLFGILVKEKKIEKIEGEVEVFIEWAYKHTKRMDIDNPIKPILDAIVEAEILEDDRDIWKLVVVKKKLEQNREPYIRVEIKKVAKNSI